MSGIAGAIDLAGRRLFPSHLLQAMGDALRHRGPDGEDRFSQDGVSAICRRLDLSPHKEGPRTGQNGPSIHVVCDGVFFPDSHAFRLFAGTFAPVAAASSVRLILLRAHTSIAGVAWEGGDFAMASEPGRHIPRQLSRMENFRALTPA